jgi:hypothetical protein
LTLREVGVPPRCRSLPSQLEPELANHTAQIGGKNEANCQFGEPSNLAEAGRGIPPLLE